MEFPIDDSEDEDDGDDGGGNDDDSDLDNGDGDDSDGNDDDKVGPARSILLKTLYAGLSWNFLNCDRAFG